MSRKGIYLVAVITALVGFLVDQASKWALLYPAGFLEQPYKEVHVLPFFKLVLWWNKGTSFSLIPTGNPYIFAILSLVIVGFLVLWLSRVATPILAIALGGVIGGAIGNVVDRLRFHAVVDFLRFEWGNCSSLYCGWPAFNIADSLIVIGIGVLVFDGMFLSHKTDKMARRKQP